MPFPELEGVFAPGDGDGMRIGYANEEGIYRRHRDDEVKEREWIQEGGLFHE